MCERCSLSSGNFVHSLYTHNVNGFHGVDFYHFVIKQIPNCCEKLKNPSSGSFDIDPEKIDGHLRKNVFVRGRYDKLKDSLRWSVSARDAILTFQYKPPPSLPSFIRITVECGVSHESVSICL
jgi:hypothetical protein